MVDDDEDNDEDDEDLKTGGVLRFPAVHQEAGESSHEPTPHLISPPAM